MSSSGPDKDCNGSNQIEQFKKENSALRQRVVSQEQEIEQLLQERRGSKTRGRICHDALVKLLETNNTCRRSYNTKRNDMQQRLRKFFDDEVPWHLLTPPSRRLLSDFRKELHQYLDGPGWPGDWARNYCDLTKWCNEFHDKFC